MKWIKQWSESERILTNKYKNSTATLWETLISSRSPPHHSISWFAWISQLLKESITEVNLLHQTHKCLFQPLYEIWGLLKSSKGPKYRFAMKKWSCEVKISWEVFENEKSSNKRRQLDKFTIIWPHVQLICWERRNNPSRPLRSFVLRGRCRISHFSPSWISFDIGGLMTWFLWS